MTRRPLVSLTLCLLCVAASTPGETADEAVFELQEISVFDLDAATRAQSGFAAGQFHVCSDVPEPAVVYPEFTSQKVIYGRAVLGVFPGDNTNASVHVFAVDAVGGSDAAFDLLYFDANADMDLTNDPPVRRRDDPPPGAILGYPGVRQEICFEAVAVEFDFGPGDRRPLEMMPRLVIGEQDDYTTLWLVTTKARRGQIQVAGHACEVLLGHSRRITGWLQQPATALYLSPQVTASWLGSDRLGAMHSIDGVLYRFSATPAGDRLAVAPYRGDWGTLKVSPPRRSVFGGNMRGSLIGPQANVAVGGYARDGSPAPADRCRLPVGDYFPAHLTVTLAGMRLVLSDNYHSDGKPRDSDKQTACGIRIRKDEIFTLDLSRKPKVLFASPAADQRLMLGQELLVKAVLVYPDLDVMIRGMAAKPQAELSGHRRWPIAALLAMGVLGMAASRKYKVLILLPVGAVVGIALFIACLVLLEVLSPPATYHDVVPVVSITRSDGRTVASGTMPFG